MFYVAVCRFMRHIIVTTLILLPLRFGFYENFVVAISSHSHRTIVFVMVCESGYACIDVLVDLDSPMLFVVAYIFDRQQHVCFKINATQNKIGEIFKCFMWICCVAWQSHATFTFILAQFENLHIFTLEFTHVALERVHCFPYNSINSKNGKYFINLK